MHGFSAQQQRRSLPKPQVPIFSGNPIEYNSFVRAFQNIIETKTTNNTERLYYLEQYTVGEVKELVTSCDHMKPDEGYVEACLLLKRNYENEYQIAAAYMEKLSKWPALKSEDNAALHKLSIFLVCCKNVATNKAFLNKFESADSMQQVVQKLLFGMRARWRRQVDEITEVNGRSVMFNDLVDFVHMEARIATHPVFGNISESSKAKRDHKPKSRQVAHKGFSFANTMQQKREDRSSIRNVDKYCEYCNRIGNYTLEECNDLRSKPYKNRIEFLMEKGICFGCLREGQVTKDCRNRATCKMGKYFKKHPTVLHTNFQDSERNKTDRVLKEDRGTTTKEVNEVKSAAITRDNKSAT